MYETDLFLLLENENLTDTINLSGPPGVDSKHTKNQVLNLYDPLDSIPLSKTEIESFFLPTTEKNDFRPITKLSKSRQSC